MKDLLLYIARSLVQQPAVINVKNDKAVEWMKKGAQPTDTVRILLKKSGAIEG